MAEFIDFYSQNVNDIAEAAQYIALNDDQLSGWETVVSGLAG